MAATTKPRILVTRKLPQEVEDRLQRDYDVTLNGDDHLMTADEIIGQAPAFDALLVTPMDNCRAEFVNRLPANIGMLATFSVGFDHIDVPAAKARGLAVSNTPDVLTNATADIAMLLILGAARGAYWGERMIREKTWTSWTPIHPLGHDVSGQRLGIFGMGRIGQAVAKRAKGFDMELHYHDTFEVPSERTHGAKHHARLEDFLPCCDFLSLNCASTPETRGIVNAETIALLPQGAIIVNTSRGDIVNDDDLIAALTSGRLAGAGLDVFRNEPNIDPRYRELENVFLLPHLGSATRRTRIAMGMRAVDNLDAFFAGKRPGDLLTG